MKTQLVFSTIFCMICLSVNAQYNSLLQKQKPDEIQRLKANKIAKRSIFLEVNGSQAPYGMTFFDEEGRITSEVTPKKHQHFTYDAAGKLINWSDSVHDGRKFFGNNYSFSYSADGKPAKFTIQNKNSNFTYDAAAKQLIEDINGSAKRIYTYNDEGKLIYEDFEESGKKIKHKYFYNKYGDLASEIQSTESPNGTDSVSVIYSYDSKGRLLRKQIINKSSVNESEDPTEPPTVTKQTETFNYTYNIQNGLLATENCVNSVPGKNYKTEWTYDNLGLLIKEAKYDAANKPVQVLVYKYYYGRK